MRYLISLRGGDRHRVVLDGEGPQLVVPSDVCGARNISKVTELRILSDPSG